MTPNTPLKKSMVDRPHFPRLVHTTDKAAPDTQHNRASLTSTVKDSREQELEQVACRSMN